MNPPDPAAAATLAAAPGDPGLYGPQSEAWRLNREAVLLLAAGPRALLLQVAHPLVAEGVDQHSAFRTDPWVRLQGTLRSFLRIVYGSTPVARAEIRRLNELHRSIRGPVRDPEARDRHGDRYTARDPELALWVHATLVDSTIVAYDRWLGPYPRAAAARFYEETRPIGRALGVPAARLPRDLDAFHAYMDRTFDPAGPIHPTATARDIAALIVHPPLGPVLPPLGWLSPALYSWTLWPAIGLLPARIRGEYGFAWGPRERIVSAWLVRTWRAWRPLLPTSLRWMPQARAADRRVAGAHGAAGRQ